MAPGIFWGLFFILIGSALVFKVVFNFDLPVFKIVFACFIILIGFKLLFTDFSFKKSKVDGGDIVFGEGFVRGKEMVHNEYSIVFGKGTFDLTDLDMIDVQSKYVKIDCVFGGLDIIINENLPIKITMESVFAGGRMPDGNSTAFGTSTYVSKSYDPLKPHINLKLGMVFGGANIVKKEARITQL